MRFQWPSNLGNKSSYASVKDRHCISLCIMRLNMIHHTPFHLSLIITNHCTILHLETPSYYVYKVCGSEILVKKKKKGHLAPVMCFLEPRLGRLENLESPHSCVLESFEGLYHSHFSHLAGMTRRLGWLFTATPGSFS